MFTSAFNLKHQAKCRIHPVHPNSFKCFIWGQSFENFFRCQIKRTRLEGFESLFVQKIILVWYENCGRWNLSKCGILAFYVATSEYPGLLRQSLKLREIASSHSEKCSIPSQRIYLFVWDHISEGKACTKNPKTCGPYKWPPLTNGMSYSCGQSVSNEKPRDKRRSSLSPSCFI